jgi:hypothetical protein
MYSFMNPTEPVINNRFLDNSNKSTLHVTPVSRASSEVMALSHQSVNENPDDESFFRTQKRRHLTGNDDDEILQQLPVSMTEPDEHHRYPCRARGISDNHTPGTAYFDVPFNAPHGLLLVCSHEICAKSGRAFRFCGFCRHPCAKRNFSKRHSHVDLNIDSGIDNYMYTPSPFENGVSAKKKKMSTPSSGPFSDPLLDESMSTTTTDTSTPRWLLPQSDAAAISLWRNSKHHFANGEGDFGVLPHDKREEEDMREFGNLCFWAEEDFDNLFAEEV